MQVAATAFECDKIRENVAFCMFCQIISEAGVLKAVNACGGS